MASLEGGGATHPLPPPCCRHLSADTGKQPIHVRDARDAPVHAERSYLDSFGGISPWLVGLVSLACGEVVYRGSTSWGKPAYLMASMPKGDRRNGGIPSMVYLGSSLRAIPE